MIYIYLHDFIHILHSCILATLPPALRIFILFVVQKLNKSKYLFALLFTSSTFTCSRRGFRHAVACPDILFSFKPCVFGIKNRRAFVSLW